LNWDFAYSIPHSGNLCSGLCAKPCGHIGCWQCGSPSEEDARAFEEMTGKPYPTGPQTLREVHDRIVSEKLAMEKLARKKLKSAGATDEDIEAAEELLAMRGSRVTYMGMDLARDDSIQVWPGQWSTELLEDFAALQAEVRAGLRSYASAYERVLFGVDKKDDTVIQSQAVDPLRQRRLREVSSP